MDFVTDTEERMLFAEELLLDSPDINDDAGSYNEMSACLKFGAGLVEIDPITGDCLEFYDTEFSNKASPLSEESTVTFDFSSLSVAAIPVPIDSNDERAWYSEPGASLLVSTFSSSISEEEGKDKEIDSENVSIGITTTDLVGEDGYEQENFTNSFGGISPAAPMVSGVTALILEANSSLTWRDVKHIFVETSNKDDAYDNGWVENGAGYDVNYRYGFGAVDAAAAVEAAEIWNPVGEEIQVSPGSYDVNLAILDYDSKACLIDLTAILNLLNKPADSNTDATDLQIEPQLSKGLVEVNPNYLESTINITEDINVEWVEVQFDANHSYRGDLKIVLVSPDGTESLLVNRDADATETGEAGQFVFSRQGNINTPLTVNYALAGCAANGIDYQPLTETVTIPAGETQATIATVSNSDCQLEANDTIYTFSLFHECKQHIKTWLSKFYKSLSSGLYHFCMKMRLRQRTGLRLRSARTVGLFLQNCSNLWHSLDLLYRNLLFPSSAWEPAWAMAGSGSPQLWQMSDNLQSSKVTPAASSSKSSKNNAPENEELDPPLSALEEDILTALGYKERYGLEIIEVIERASEGTRKLGPGSLYPTLRRLQKKGYLESRWGDDDDGTGERGGARRRYYKVSDRGLKKLQQTRSFRERLILASGGEQILAGA